MTKLRHVSSGLVLILALSGAVLGGTIDTPGPTPPPPPGSPSTVTAGETAKPGEIHIPGALSDSVTDAALNLLQAFFTVF